MFTPFTFFKQFCAGLCLVFLVIGFALPSSAHAAVIYVKANASGANSGANWTDAFTDLQAALALAVGGDEIWVAAGHYFPTGGTDRKVSFRLKNGVGLYGGFNGTEALRTERPATLAQSWLDGDINTANNVCDLSKVDSVCDNSLHVVWAEAVDSSTVLDGFLILNGEAFGLFNEGKGGGMFITADASPTLNKLTFINNQALEGAGMFNRGSPTISNSFFIGNVSFGIAGGMYNYYASPTLNNVSFTAFFSNRNVAGSAGGGMYNYFSSPTLNDVRFFDNRAGTDGGGIYNSNSTPTLNRVSFSANVAKGYGGGMLNTESSLTLNEVSFSTNQADISGGGMFNDRVSSTQLNNVSFDANKAKTSGSGLYNRGSSPALNHVVFSNNISDTGGGAMSNASVIVDDGNGGFVITHYSNPVLNNVTFSGNSGYQGGAMDNAFANPVIYNATFYGNSAVFGGAVNSIDSDPIFYNSVFWGNTASNSGTHFFDFSGSAPVLNSSLVENGCPSGVTCNGGGSGDPMLQALADNGGFTKTHALGAGSAAINAGSNATCLSDDQRGATRAKTAGDACDLGAFEAVATYALTVATTGPGAGTVSSSGTPSGVACGANCVRYVGSAVIQLTATADANSTFSSWSAGCADGMSLSSDKTCTATFKLRQSIVFSALPDKTYGDAAFSVSATGGGSNEPVTFTADGDCTINVNTVSLTGAGTCTITAHQGGNGDYAAAENIAQSFNIAKAGQTIDFAALTTKTYGDAAFSVSASGGTSGEPVTFTANGDCTINADTVSLTGAGTCTITARQGGNGDYSPATDVPRSFSINKAVQTLSITAVDNKTYGDAPFAVGFTAGASGEAVTFAADGKCSVNGTTVSLTGAGECTLTATQAGNNNYLAASEASENFSIAKADATVSLLDSPSVSLPGESAVLRYAVTPVSAHAQQSVTGNVTVSTTDGECTGTVAEGQCAMTINSIGPVSLSLSYGGDDNFNAASSTGKHVVPDMAAELISLQAGSDWVGQSFTASFFKNPVLIVSPPTFNDKMPGVVRLNNIDTTGFDIRFQPWDYLQDTPHAPENMSVLVVEQGVHELADGSVWEAGTFQLGISPDSKKAPAIEFVHAFPKKPKLFLSVQSQVGANAVTVRSKSVGKTKFTAVLQEQQANRRPVHPEETIGYLAIYSPADQGAFYLADGGNRAYLVRHPTAVSRFKPVAQTDCHVKIEEENSKDKENRHLPNRVPILILPDAYPFVQLGFNGKDTAALRLSCK